MHFRNQQNLRKALSLQKGGQIQYVQTLQEKSIWRQWKLHSLLIYQLNKNTLNLINSLLLSSAFLQQLVYRS